MGLDDHEWQRRYDDYSAQLESLRRDLSSGAELLVPETLNLHDGQLRDWSLGDGTFTLVTVIGDRQVGYEWATISYRDAVLHPDSALADFDGWPLTACEIAADELTTAGGRFEHRFLLWPDGEFAVRFGSCGLARRPATAAAWQSG